MKEMPGCLHEGVGQKIKGNRQKVQADNEEALYNCVQRICN